MSEWVEHHGKGAPDLPPGTEVYVRFRDGLGGLGWGHTPFEWWSPDDSDPRDYWTHSNDREDIVAYKAAGQ